MKTMNRLLICTVIVMMFAIVIINSCKKEDDTNNDQTQSAVPTLTTASITNITSVSATSGGNISADGGAAVSARGVCWSTGQAPTTADSKTTDGTGTGNFTSNITGLSANTTYYVRAYATNSAGTGYGSAVQFTTLSGAGGTVTDIDGNVYNTVTIGTQVWMVENLKVTKYRNGDPIPEVTDGTQWSNLTTGAYCNYSNSVTYADTYGRLYNWYVIGDSRLICPAGWHVPSDAEWTTLTDFLGGLSVAGGKMKEAGSAHWALPNTGGTNQSGFTALPGGWRGYDKNFHDILYTGFWWSSTDVSASAWNRQLYQGTQNVDRISLNKYLGFSIRCIKD